MNKFSKYILGFAALVMSATAGSAQEVKPFDNLSSVDSVKYTYTTGGVVAFGTNTTKDKCLVSRIFYKNNILFSAYGSDNNVTLYQGLYPTGSKANTYGYVISKITYNGKTNIRTVAMSHEDGRPITKLVLLYETPINIDAQIVVPDGATTVSHERISYVDTPTKNNYRDTIVLKYPMRVVPLSITGGTQINVSQENLLQYAQRYNKDGSQNSVGGTGTVAVLECAYLFTKNDRGCYTEQNIGKAYEAYGNLDKSNSVAQEVVNYYVNRLNILKKDATSLSNHYEKGSDADVNEDGTVNSTDVVSVYNRITNGEPNVINGQKYVDLGLPSGILWAACNVGAQSPEGYGDYFAWGESTASLVYLKTSFTNSNYKYGSTPIDAEVLPREYTPLNNLYASAWKGWTVPTLEDVNELKSNTSSKEATVNGIKGVLLTSKKNGNTLFFPYNGKIAGTNHTDAGEVLNLWTRTGYGPNAAWQITGHSGLILTGYSPFGSYMGQGWRAVYKPE